MLRTTRGGNGCYLLCNIMFLAVAGVMCGCESWQDLEEGPEYFGRLRRFVLNKLRAYRDPDGKDTPWA